VRIVRRHHPLLGQSFEVLQGGPRYVVVRVAEGATMRIPRAWTDASGAPNDEGAQTVLTVEAVRELASLVAALRRREGR
jgi:hypothetical protein